MSSYLDIKTLPFLYANWQGRYAERDSRMASMDAVVRGEYGVVDPDEEGVESRSPNLIQVALEDTAEAASIMPTIRVTPCKTGVQAKKNAASMERIAAGYFESAKMDTLLPTTVMDLAAFGIEPWVIMPDYEQRIPLIEWRDPRFCYPEPGMRVGDAVRKCIFARSIFLSQLPAEYQALVAASITDPTFDAGKSNTRLVLVEYFDECEVVVAALWQAASGLASAQGTSYTPIELSRWEHELGVCPVVIGARITLDGEHRGQFDQVVGTLLAHVRLMGMVLDYADQAVYSDIWVRDLIGEMPYGGGAYIELGPQGAIGRVPPAVTSLQVQNDLQMLVDAIHVGGRWPKSRPGEIDQSIASAKFLEASAGMMNTAIKTYHTIVRRMMEAALRISFMMDKKLFPGKKTVTGVLRNQQFVEEYDTNTIDLDHNVRVEYGLGLGRDPSQSAVLMLQYAQAQDPFISHEFVMENIDGLTDVARELSRIDIQQFRKMALARLLQGLETGQVPEKALLEIAEARAKGDDLFELYRKFIIDPQEAAAGASVTSGLTGESMLPPEAAGALGLPPGPGGPAGLPAGPLPPPPPEAAGMLARLGIPAGPGGLLGTQIQT